MCGIAGFFTPEHMAASQMDSISSSMARRLSHRGPDDEGVWNDNFAGIALAHRRLSIVDLSAAGHQPMSSPCGRYVIIFNGEIYNHQDIREDLLAAGHSTWKGHSDTETLLTAISAWGVERSLKATVGMFAFALWDRAARSLTLARDRLGERPLYYGIQNGTFLFASELKAFHAHPSFTSQIDRQALASYFQLSVVPTPQSIYRQIYKLPPATWLTIHRNDIVSRTLPTPSPYWSLKEIVGNAQADLFTGSHDEAAGELDRLLRISIKGQMLSDVPLGAFLSGGIDSSTIVALMQSQSSDPIKTFTIGFDEKGFNEADHARLVAKHLGTAHTELLLRPEQAMDVIPKLPSIYDEPFADVSQIPTFLVSELARQHVTVSLSGDGGDELFGGYNRYTRATHIWRQFGWMPYSVRAAVARILMSCPPAVWDQVLDGLRFLVPSGWRYSMAGSKIHKIADMLGSRSADEIYFRLLSRWGEGETPLASGVEQDGAGFSNIINVPESLTDLEHRMMYLDSVTYLPNDILVKVDRAAMANSLEARAPFLDHRVIEFAWRLPLRFKIDGGRGKLVLNSVLNKYVPRSITSRPKAGFAVPIDTWLRGPLKLWANDLLDPSVLRNQGYLSDAVVGKKWGEHLSGKRNWSAQIWSIVMFQAWLSTQ